MTPEDAADFAPEACAGPFEDPEYHELLAATIELNPVSSKPIANDLFEVSDLHGGHEVIVETPQHVESLTALEPQHAGRVFEAYAERMRHWYDVPGVEYVVAFKNVGAAAGASLRHTHSQLIATSLLPPAMSEIGRRVTQHYRRHQKCLLCDMLEGELERGERIVLETERFLVFCPFASRLPYLVRIAPRMHSDRFELANASMLHELSRVAQQCLGAMEAMFSSCAYNYTLHTRPRNVASAASFHWWMEIFPRLTKVAGFEWGSDCYINPVTPELAASQLRKVISAKSSMG
jgi:UDPglucose--hexose-1-phosphate uridylyltransferase